MAITKMSLVKLNGNVKNIDDTMVKCCNFGMFHPERASLLEEYEKNNDSFLEYSKNTGYLRKIVDLAGKLGLGLFKDQISDLKKFEDSDKINSLSNNLNVKNDIESKAYNNQYKNLLDICNEIFAKLNLKVHEVDNDNINFNLSIDEMCKYLENIKSRILYLQEQKEINQKKISDYMSAIVQLNNLYESNINFDRLFACRYLKIRFGRLPKESYEKLSILDNDNFVFVSFKLDSHYSWCVYITPLGCHREVDSMFKSLFFERIRIPVCAHDTPSNARAHVEEQIIKHRNILKSVNDELDEIKKVEQDKLMQLYSKIKFFSQCFDNKKYAAVFEDRFYIIGFIPQDREHDFVKQFSDLKDVDITISEPMSDKRIKAPVKLKNNRFSRPFEDFVAMYGLPDYQNVDPTVFLSFFYTLFFGIMFGDIGQGLVIALIGFVWSKLKGSNFAKILTRIGLSSAFFGVIYGSCFGYEDLFESYILKFPEPYRDLMLNLSHKDTNFLLIGAIGIGVCANIFAMLFNMFSGVKQKKASIYLFGQNGLAGLTFYASLILAIVGNKFLKINVLNPWFIILCLVLPLILIWVKEPLGDKVDGREVKIHDGVGMFLMENFFELYEVILGFVSNTISFVRVGAFVISHAGIMSVVMNFARSMPQGGNILMLIFGNLFVIGFEGLIVGIQVLRLQFYEIFSRCFDGAGKPFKNI